MKFYVGAVILLATVANLMTLHTVKCDHNLYRVVQNCFKKNRATCQGIISFRDGLNNGVVGTNRDVLSYFACLFADSEVMTPQNPFNLDNFNRWYGSGDWPRVDPIVSKCSGGPNRNVGSLSDRIFQYLKCANGYRQYKTFRITTTVVPATC